MGGTPSNPRRTVLLVAAAIVVVLGAGSVYLAVSPTAVPKLKGYLYTLRGYARWKATLPHRPEPLADSLAQLGSGWIYLGNYDTKRHAYREGPYAEVAYRSATGGRGAIVPRIGDVLRIRRSRQVIIANYSVDGKRHQLIAPPFVHELMSGLDTTGVWLAAETLVLVADVEMPWRLGKPRSVWCRVTPCGPGSESCRRAREELEAAGGARPEPPAATAPHGE